MSTMVAWPRAIVPGATEVIVGPRLTVKHDEQTAVPLPGTVTDTSLVPSAALELMVSLMVRSVELVTTTDLTTTPAPVKEMVDPDWKPLPLTFTSRLVAPCPSTRGDSDVTVTPPPCDGVTALDGAEGALGPTPLVAVTVNVYRSPLVRPETVIGLPTADAVWPPFACVG